ncbi:methionine--tRNA ligase [Candidatus Amesbacteria bacterium]|nr:methionine--tRNA ligase [Candidatus Amesbacteria bacterium]
MKKFYITAAIPYVNATGHIGHCLEFVQADTIARYRKLLGDDVLLLSGGDENALKNVQAAEKAGVPIQEFVDKNSQLFYELTKKLNTQFDVWQKGRDKEHHFVSSQELWRKCEKDIYKKAYKGLYCVGCEAFYEVEELNEKGECFEHPGKKLDKVEEENYFFKLSKYQDKILELIKSGELEIVPEERKNEVLSFVKSGLKDISISRSNERARNWGVPVPGDDNSKIYVWMDALNIYQSGVGFGWDEEKYNKWWPADLHVIGKGIIRFHAVYWPAFLLSAGLKLPKKIFVHGYYTVDGQKMSKTLGNVYDPIPLLEKYGADPLRYYCLAKTPPFTDGDFSEEKFIEAYNSDLANGLGNLVARVAKLCERAKIQGSRFKIQFQENKFLNEFRFDEAIRLIWERISEVDKQIEKDQPWKLEGEKLNDVLKGYVEGIRKIATELRPFLPETAEKILKQFSGPKIKSEAPLFPRIK